jgi:hypothetical protein
MSEVITDAKGRKFTTRKINVLDQVKLLRAIGAEQSSNQPYVEIVMMVASVADIDGTPCPIPTNERQIDAAIARIGDEGFAAFQVYTKKVLAELVKAAEDAANAVADGEVKSADPLVPSA